MRLVRRLPSPGGPASVPYRLVLKQLVYAAITKRAAKEDPARYTGMRPPRAGMAELADAKVSKTFERKLMGVRSPLPAPFKSGTCSGGLNPPFATSVPRRLTLWSMQRPATSLAG